MYYPRLYTIHIFHYYSLIVSDTYTCTLHFRLVFPPQHTHTADERCRGAYEKHFQAGRVVSCAILRRCSTTLQLPRADFARENEGKTTDDVHFWLCASSTIRKTCVLRHSRFFPHALDYSLGESSLQSRKARDERENLCWKIRKSNVKNSLLLFSNIKYSEIYFELVLDWTSRGDYVHT